MKKNFVIISKKDFTQRKQADDNQSNDVYQIPQIMDLNGGPTEQVPDLLKAKKDKLQTNKGKSVRISKKDNVYTIAQDRMKLPTYMNGSIIYSS